MSADVANEILGFLRDIGLAISEADVPDDTFLPGILVLNGGLVVDRNKLKYPGDLLHEAGHLAVMPSRIRAAMSGVVDSPDGPMEPVEATAIAWSYAAAMHLGLDPRIVFHSEGYLGRADSVVQNFELGVYFGVQGLIDAGLTRPLTEAGPYPQMHRWLAE